MIATSGHTLQLGEQDERDHRTGALVTRVTLECTCGACFVDALVAAHPTGTDLARIRAKGWPASQLHLKTVSGLVSEPVSESSHRSPISNQQSAISNQQS
jgi:hypothetical protein